MNGTTELFHLEARGLGFGPLCLSVTAGTVLHVHVLAHTHMCGNLYFLVEQIMSSEGTFPVMVAAESCQQPTLRAAGRCEHLSL